MKLQNLFFAAVAPLLFAFPALADSGQIVDISATTNTSACQIWEPGRTCNSFNLQAQVVVSPFATQTIYGTELGVDSITGTLNGMAISDVQGFQGWLMTGGTSTTACKCFLPLGGVDFMAGGVEWFATFDAFDDFFSGVPELQNSTSSQWAFLNWSAVDPPAPAPAPEPGSFALLVIGIIPLLKYRNRSRKA